MLAKAIAIPDYQSLILPVLQFSKEGETKVPIAAKKIVDGLGLTQEDRDEMLPSGKQRLLYKDID
ncbi:winged helix-turn-helix domain-containing protein [Parasphingorhabdus sp.]|uniref:winged helix-turn-helix domain-containing protein n=1 Tax=Parasphingorhabdus sp. TaxID=2709688 RepID=UPI0035934FD7